MSILDKEFGKLSTGEVITEYRIVNEAGAYVDLIDFGCIIVDLGVPDKNGEITDVVLGYNLAKHYEKNGCFFGALIGRNGNRIGGAKFVIDGQEYTMTQNENTNNLHSAPDGYEKKFWTVTDKNEETNSITFSRLSPDGESGFPGNFNASVTYTLTENNALTITYDGVSDKATIANLTNHSYFNLHGEGNGNILDIYLKLNAAYYTPVASAEAIPTGEYAPTAGTPFDFSEFKQIGQDINSDFEQIQFGGGFDHNLVTDNYKKGFVRKIAEAYSDKTGIVMEVFSDLPCVQFYSGNFIVEEWGKNSHIYGKRDGFCLETQVEPNAVNQEGFHSPVIAAGEKYHTVTSYKFSVK